VTMPAREAAKPLEELVQMVADGVAQMAMAALAKPSRRSGDGELNAAKN
jgi:hypothetical protein